jgi:iron complex transport system substrate-binding protein
MKAKLTAIFVLLLFGGALILSNRRGSPYVGHVRVKVLEVTPKYRLIEHSLGETKVPLSPRRIASLGGAFTESLLAMGIQPVAVESSFGVGEAGKAASHLAGRLKGVPVVSGSGAVNLEAVAEAKPDLILISGSENSLWFHYLSCIAPTVCIASYGMPPDRERDAILNVGDIIGRREQAERVLAEYDQRIRQARTLLANTLGSKPVLYLLLSNQRCMSRPIIFQALLVDRLGLTYDPTVLDRPDSVTWDFLSTERLSRLQAEYIFVGTSQKRDQSWSTIADSPYCRMVPAIQHGHVYQVRHSTWTGPGVLACEKMIDEILAAAQPERSSR